MAFFAIMYYMEIANIKHYPQFEEEVASWLNSEWGSKTSLNYWKEWLEYSKDEQSLFQTFVLVEGNKVLATYGIMPCDLQSRQELSPWVGNLFIPKKYRLNSMKYLHEISHHSEQVYRKLNIKKIFVYTPHNPKVFARFGYKFIEYATGPNGERVSLLYKDIV